MATDVAARGLDIPGIDMVVHYHVPRTADAYVHRSGRTARADCAGLSVLLCAPEEVAPTRRLLARLHLQQQRRRQQHQSGDEKKSDPAAVTASSLLRTVDLDRRLAARLRPRVELAKRLADAGLARDRGAKEDGWLRAAAEELGVDYDEDQDGVGGGGREVGGRGAAGPASPRDRPACRRTDSGGNTGMYVRSLPRAVPGVPSW